MYSTAFISNKNLQPKHCPVSVGQCFLYFPDWYLRFTPQEEHYTYTFKAHGCVSYSADYILSCVCSVVL